MSAYLYWLDSLDEDDELYLPGYVVMELIQGCRYVQKTSVRPLDNCGGIFFKNV